MPSRLLDWLFPKVRGHWYSAPPMGRAKGLALAAALTTVWAGVCLSPLGESLAVRLEHRLAFTVRHRLGLDPPFDPRLKVLAVNEETLAALDLEYLPPLAWAELFEKIAERQPSALLIDKVFATARAREGTFHRFRKAVQTDFPFVGGALVSPVPLPHRGKLPENHPALRLGRWAPAGAPELPIRKSYAYGPNPNLLTAFRHLGMLNYLPNGYLEAFHRLGPDSAVPLWGLLAADSLVLDDGKLYAGGVRVPLDGQGRILANVVPEESFQRFVQPLEDHLKLVRTGQPLPGIHRGDVVVILSQLHHGGSPLIETAAGTLAAPLVHLAALNSALTGRWLRPFRGSLGTLVTAGALGGFLAFRLAPLTLLLTLGGLSGLFAVTGLWLFAYFGWVVPWLFWIITLVTTGLGLLLERLRVQETKSRQVRRSLEGMMDPRKLDELLADPRGLRFDPSHQVLTVMFIDIVGFSQSAERHDPEAVFHQLKEVMDLITPVIHRRGGIIDKTLGDGLLCFFGYRHGAAGAGPTANHAEQAVECAREIQHRMLQRNGEAAARGLPPYPLRIGINTELVYIGDLGGPGRIEFTVIGNGVNLAQRLESACETYRILLSATTRDRLPAADAGELRSRRIRIKHHEDLMEVHELDPFHRTPDLLAKANQVYRQYLGRERVAPRWEVDGGNPIQVELDGRSGDLVNFSRTGLGLLLPRYYGPGVTLQLQLRSGDGSLEGVLREKGLGALVAEVRWGRPLPTGYLHGVALRNLTPAQGEVLEEELRAACRLRRAWAS